jgi:hypothetical protein
MIIKPGGMATDVEDHKLGMVQRHLEVKNLRQTKVGLWEVVKPYIELDIFGLSGVVSAEEFYYKNTDERFMLVQLSGTNNAVRRYNYSSGYSSTYTTISFPSGVTIPTGNKLRYFFYNNVIRITGASEPLWYGYIDETLFQKSYSDLYLNYFDTSGDETDFTAVDGSVGYETTIKLYSNGSLKLVCLASLSSPYCYRHITSSVAKKHKIYLRLYNPNTSVTMSIKIGSTANGAEYTSEEFTTLNEWLVFDYEFETAVSSFYITFRYSGSTAYFMNCYLDYVWVKEPQEIILQDWYMRKTKIEPLTVELDYGVFKNRDTSTDRTNFMKAFLGYDGSQYSLPADIDRLYTNTGTPVTDFASEIYRGTNTLAMLDIITGNIAVDTGIVNERISGIYLLLSSLVGLGSAIKETELSYYTKDVLSFREAVEDVYYLKDNFNYSATYKNRLYLTSTVSSDQFYPGDGLFRIGQKIKLVNSVGSLNTVITNIYFSGADFGNYMEVLDNIYPALKSSDTDGDLTETSVQNSIEWSYLGAAGYSLPVSIDLTTQITAYDDFTGVSQNEESISPNYDHHIIIDNVAHVNSKEADEYGLVRVSPIYQFDVLPKSSNFRTATDPAYDITTLVNRDNKLMVLKEKSFSQGLYYGGLWREGASEVKTGIIGADAYLVWNSALYYMDKDDIYVYFGAGQPQALMKTELMRKIYREYVNNSSFMLWNKYENELLVILNGLVLVYHAEAQEWYVRETGLSPAGGFLDYDNNLILYTSNLVVNLNNTGSSGNELVNWSFTTEIIDLNKPDMSKNFFELIIPIMSNGNFDVTLDSVHEALNKVLSGNIPGSSSLIKPKRIMLKFLGKELKMKVSGSSASSDKTCNIREIELNILGA